MMKTWQGACRSGIVAVAVVACLALAACSGDTGGGATPAAPGSTGTVSGQVTSASDGSAVAGATVSTAAGSTTSAVDGSFTVMASAGPSPLLHVEAAGFAEAFPVGRVAAGVTAALKVLLLPTGHSTSVTVANGATVTVPNSTAQVTIPANGLVPKAGGGAAGTVTVAITPINPAVNPNVMPGGFMGVAAGGGSPAPMESFGAMLVDIRDDTGARYTLAPGTTSTIRIPVGTRSTAPPGTSPLFFFDESTRLWKEEGTATLQGIAPHQYYEGTVTHFSYWNADKLSETVYVSGCLRDSNNQPVANALIETNGLDYSGLGLTTTQPDGTFTVGLRSGSVAMLSAVDFPLLFLPQPSLSNVINIGPSTVDFTVPTCLIMGPTPLTISTSTLPGGRVGMGYNQILAASGGVSGYTWSLNPGSNPLPAGLSLKPWGVITGAPTASGTKLITVKVVDTSGTVVTKSLSLTITSGSTAGLPSFAQAALEAYVKASNTGSGDDFGVVVAISGDTLVVGASGEDSASTGIDGDQTNDFAERSGAVYVFVRDNSGVWTQQAYLKGVSGNGIVGSRGFGGRIAISGDTLAVGAAAESNFGAVYVFTRANGVWSQQAYIQGFGGTVFGSSVALAGDTLAVGAIGDGSAATGINGNQADSSAPSSGAVHVFTRANGVWSQQAYVKASNTQEYDEFGSSVALAGDTLVVGVPHEGSTATGINGNQADNSAPGSGAVYVFTRTNGVWSQQAYVKGSNTQADDWFGSSVALAGDTLVVGAPFEASATTGINGNQANNSAPGSGAAYVFTRTNSVWSQQAYVKASNTQADDGFGLAVSISGNTLVIGAENESSASGAAYVFARNPVSGIWKQEAYVKASNTDAHDLFGGSVALSGDTLVVGARHEASNATGINGIQTDNAALGSGAVYIYRAK